MLRKNRDKETTKIRAKVLAFPLTCMKVFINDICCTCIDLDLRWTCGGLFISYDTWGSERDARLYRFQNLRFTLAIQLERPKYVVTEK